MEVAFEKSREPSRDKLDRECMDALIAQRNEVEGMMQRFVEETFPQRCAG
jgi:hypothetical protein